MYVPLHSLQGGDRHENYPSRSASCMREDRTRIQIGTGQLELILGVSWRHYSRALGSSAPAREADECLAVIFHRMNDHDRHMSLTILHIAQVG